MAVREQQGWFGVVLAGLALVAVASADSKGRPPATPEHLESVVRYNGTDDDAQILFLAKDEELAFSRLSITAPDGRRVLADRTLGLTDVGQSVADIRTSQHPLARIKRAYPPGTYRWKGRMLSGKRLVGSSRLRYGLLDPPVITAPADEAREVPTGGARIEWKPVPAAEAVFVEVEDDNSSRGRELLVRLDGDATSFEIPDQFLKPHTEYAVELKALARNGNQSAADYSFTTGV